MHFDSSVNTRGGLVMAAPIKILIDNFSRLFNFQLCQN